MGDLSLCEKETVSLTMPEAAFKTEPFPRSGGSEAVGSDCRWQQKPFSPLLTVLVFIVSQEFTSPLKM